MIWYSKVWNGIKQGMEWYSKVWYGIARYGMVSSMRWSGKSGLSLGTEWSLSLKADHPSQSDKPAFCTLSLPHHWDFLWRYLSTSFETFYIYLDRKIYLWTNVSNSITIPQKHLHTCHLLKFTIKTSQILLCWLYTEWFIRQINESSIKHTKDRSKPLCNV